jgi:hypothetical protein
MNKKCHPQELQLEPHLCVNNQVSKAGIGEPVSSTYANILKYLIQGMPTNIILQVFI